MPDPGVLAVVYGGPSAEHEVSCVSARRIVASALQSGFTVKVIGLTHDKQWVDANRVLTDVADMEALPSPDDLLQQDAKTALTQLDSRAPALAHRPLHARRLPAHRRSSRGWAARTSGCTHRPFPR